ncbi:MAG: hypothetical protein IKL55_01530 [Clostridia bacterium]|nr:hypothetical protein [Clostridia bacterium]
MANSEEVLKKIEEISGLEDEIMTIIAKSDFKKFYNENLNDDRLIELIGNTDGLTEEDVIKKLADNYKNPSGIYLGFCHGYWSVKKSILKNKYNIEWETPQEENPHIEYD